jgi:hypothetical protein
MYFILFFVDPSPSQSLPPSASASILDLSFFSQFVVHPLRQTFHVFVSNIVKHLILPTNFLFGQITSISSTPLLLLSSFSSLSLSLAIFSSSLPPPFLSHHFHWVSILQRAEVNGILPPEFDVTELLDISISDKQDRKKTSFFERQKTERGSLLKLNGNTTSIVKPDSSQKSTISVSSSLPLYFWKDSTIVAAQGTVVSFKWLTLLPQDSLRIPVTGFVSQHLPRIFGRYINGTIIFIFFIFIFIFFFL